MNIDKLQDKKFANKLNTRIKKWLNMLYIEDKLDILRADTGVINSKVYDIKEKLDKLEKTLNRIEKKL